jgi:hypothetical protein
MYTMYSFVSKKSTRTAIMLPKLSPGDSYLFPELKQILGGHKLKADREVEQLGRDEWYKHGTHTTWQMS